MQFLADMNAEESYFLLLDDPVHFQLDYQALANLGRHSAGRQRLYRRRKDCTLGRLPVLAGYDLGTYQTTVLRNHRYWRQRRTGKRIIFRPQGLL